MNAIVKRIWALYSFIWVISISVLIFIGFSTWNTIIDKKKVEQQASIELFARGVQGLLESQDLVLTLLGNQLRDYLPLTEQSVATATQQLDKLLSKNPSVYAFAFILPDGHIAMATSNMAGAKPGSENPVNFLDNPITQ